MDEVNKLLGLSSKNEAIQKKNRSGIIHQINLEHLAEVVARDDASGFVYPETQIGTDSHTTMINGLGVLGWGVGGIEAEAAMLGEPVSMLIPDVIGVRLSGEKRPGIAATEIGRAHV